MKVGRRRRSPLLALVLSASLLPVLASSATSARSAVDAPSLPRRDVAVDSPNLSGIKANRIGTEHAPVDGKDGMPHSGPFVETETERSRKKNKDVDDAELRPLSSDLTDKYGDQDLPVTNDAVMDARSKSAPIEGTRGTEGGVTEKSKDSKTVDKVPDSPKEARPLPQSEVEKLWQSADSGSAAPETGDRILEKTADILEKSHNLPYTESTSSLKDNSKFLDHTSSTSDSTSDEEDSAVIQPLHSLFLSFTMIMFSEIGDKTFLVAALMAMRHDRVVVFTAAYTALITMTVLSAVLGHAVPHLIPKAITNFLAAALFLVFGVKMVFEARGMSPDEGISEEMKEVEMELEEKEQQHRRLNRRRSSISPYVLEAGRGVRKATTHNGRLPSPPDSPSPSSSRDGSPSRRSTWWNMLAGVNNLFSLLLSPAWVQTFVMTFLGEWGDRSQIATIAMAAGQDYWWVTAGALVGHGICTGAAVLGGKAIAGRVSMRTVTMGGAIAFLVFGFIYFVEAIY